MRMRLSAISAFAALHNSRPATTAADSRAKLISPSMAVPSRDQFLECCDRRPDLSDGPRHVNFVILYNLISGRWAAPGCAPVPAIVAVRVGAPLDPVLRIQRFEDTGDEHHQLEALGMAKGRQGEGVLHILECAQSLCLPLPGGR